MAEQATFKISNTAREISREGRWALQLMVETQVPRALISHIAIKLHETFCPNV